LARSEVEALAAQRAQERDLRAARPRRTYQRLDHHPDTDLEWLSVPQVAELLGVTMPAVSGRIHRGTLPATENHGRFWVRRDLLEQVQAVGVLALVTPLALRRESSGAVALALSIVGTVFAFGFWVGFPQAMAAGGAVLGWYPRQQGSALVDEHVSDRVAGRDLQRLRAGAVVLIPTSSQPVLRRDARRVEAKNRVGDGFLSPRRDADDYWSPQRGQYGSSRPLSSRLDAPT
jgi:hypothetical protein